MRQIKFRGKALDGGEWFYGSLVCLPDSQSCHIITSGSYKPHIGAFAIDEVEVDPATVGQYTGYDDADGREIYEGDVLKSEYFEHAPGQIDPCKAVWLEDGWCCSTAYEMGVTLCTALSYGAKLIGNIFDNPELLEPEKTSES